MTKITNANAVGSQRKRNANQAKPNIASQSNQQSQQNSKKGNKPQNPTQNQSNAAKPATSTPSSTPIPPPVAQAEEPHVALKGFNAEEIDALLKSGYDEKALIYKAEQPPWGQKRTFSPPLHHSFVEADTY